LNVEVAQTLISEDRCVENGEYHCCQVADCHLRHKERVELLSRPFS
jgi:hypothetical protein